MIVVSRMEQNKTWFIRIEFSSARFSTGSNVCGLGLRYESWTYDDKQRSRAIAHYKDLIKRNYSWT